MAQNYCLVFSRGAVILTVEVCFNQLVQIKFNLTRTSNGKNTVGCFHSVQHFSQQYFSASVGVRWHHFSVLLLTNFRVFNIGWMVILFRGFSPKRFVNVANHCRESSNNISVVR
jgi:hypothetical protein